MTSILRHFPYSKFWPHQEEILLELEDNFRSYEYIFLEAPTGFGKSVIAYTLAKWVQSEFGEYSHFCVADKYLQDQYLRDFKDLVLMKGKVNFNCVHDQNLTFSTCDVADCAVVENFDCPHKPTLKREDEYSIHSSILRDDHGVVFDWYKITGKRCLYWKQKDMAIRNDLTIHNYFYFLYEQNYAKQFNRRGLGVFDEGHIAEDVLLQFIKYDIFLRSLNSILERGNEKVVIPRCDNMNDWIAWLRYLLRLLESESVTTAFKRISIQVEFRTARRDDQSLERDSRLLVRYKNMKSKLTDTIVLMLADKENWVWERRDERVTFKPVTVREYAEKLFGFTNKKLLMSATFLNLEKMKDMLGIKDDAKFIRVEESNFLVKNRPFILDLQGRASYRTLDTYLTKALDRIDNFYIPSFRADKGVIHTHTNRIARFIVKNSKFRNIMMTNVDNRERREKVFQRFFDSYAPKIMVTPSMRMGVDLKDDLCRWQLIVKVPYPSLADPQIKKRLELDQEWYDWTTLVSLIQTYGRGCRSTTDWCKTFILDSSFEWLARKNREMLPVWFKEAIIKDGVQEFY